MKKRIALALCLLLVGIMCQASMIMTREEVVWLMQSMFPKESARQEILNWDNPDWELRYYRESTSTENMVPRFIRRPDDLKGHTLWIATYRTNRDAVLGPITLYIDYHTGTVWGANPRY